MALVRLKRGIDERSARKRESAPRKSSTDNPDGGRARCGGNRSDDSKIVKGLERETGTDRGKKSARKQRVQIFARRSALNWLGLAGFALIYLSAKRWADTF